MPSGTWSLPPLAATEMLRHRRDEHRASVTKLPVDPGMDSQVATVALAVDHHLEIAAFFVLSLAFFAIVGVVAKAHARRHRKSLEYTARLSSVLHGIIATTLTLGNVMARMTRGDAYHADTTLQEGLLLSFSLAYFAIDTVAIINGDFFDVLFLAHHVGCFWALFYTIASGSAGYLMTLNLLFTEITNPFMNVHWLNVFDRRTTGAVYHIPRLGFIALFTLARAIVGPWLLYMCWAVGVDWLRTVLGYGIFVFSLRTLHRIVAAELNGVVWVA